MRFIIYIFFLTIGYESIAQNIEIPHRNYSTKNNFISDNIYCIFKDSKGLLWFGTDAGVLQFDGSNFRLLTTREGLPDNEVFNFCEDYEGRIWFATFNGNMGYYMQGQLYNETSTNTLMISDHPSFIYHIGIQYDSSVLFFYFNSDLFSEYKYGRFKTTHLNIKRNKNEYIHAISKVNEEEYCVFTNECRYKIRAGRILQKDTSYKSNFYSYNENVFERRSDSLYIIDHCSYHFIAKLDNSLLVPYTFYFEDSVHLFAGTVKGLFELNPKEKNINYQNYLKDCKVSSINKDIEDNYWIGTLNKGAYFIPNNFKKIQYYKLDTIDKIINFTSYNGNIILLTEDQKVYKLSSTGTIKLHNNFGIKYKFPSGNNRFYPAIYKNYLLIGGSYNASIDLDKPDKFSKWNQYTKYYWRDINIIQDTIYGHTNYSIAKSVIPNNSSSLNSTISNQVEYYVPDDHQRIFDITLFKNVLWVSTSNNLYYLDQKILKLCSLGKFKSFKKFNFYNNNLVGITHDNKILFGIFNEENKFKFQEFDPSCIWIDMNYIFENRVLLSSDKGYYILDFSLREAKLEPIENVLLPNSPKDIVCDSPFVFFLNSDNEITKIKYADIKFTPFPPLLNILSVSINGKLTTFNKIIEVPERECENITIDFTGIGFNRKKINYQYSFDGSNWVNLESPKLILIHPESGKYNIRLRCRSDSSPYGNESLVNFIVLPPWYKSIWLMVTSILLCFTIVWYVIRYIIRRNIEEKELKHAEELKFQHAEFKALNALMNPHFVFNSLNNIQYLINNGNKASANEFLNTFSLLIRQNIENIKQELISLDKEIDLVKNYLQIEKLRFQDRLQFEINIPDEIELDSILIPPLLVQPLVENAIKHGIFMGSTENGQIWINVYEHHDQLMISIINSFNDESIELNKSGLNLSLENIKSRLKKLEFVHLKKYSLEIHPILIYKGKTCFESKIIIDY